MAARYVDAPEYQEAAILASSREPADGESRDSRGSGLEALSWTASARRESPPPSEEEGLYVIPRQ
ncbi:hypothetical protein HMPREF0043_00203 [Actinobaculum sp. oral taxon 183 str. F0552]|nr:hypothetical protein HMPREF0043_00203 [Actinobaculum sp. oral taxon 183 str. F0552]